MEHQGRVWYAPEQVQVAGSLVFLAGPIQGTRDWQAEMVAHLQAIAPAIDIANPRRGRLESDFAYAEQVDWETEQLARAGRNGVIVFWLAKEAEHDAKRAYAQTSRVELGEWMVRAQQGAAKLVVGMETGFPGARYIGYRLAQMCPQVPVVRDEMKVAALLVKAALTGR
jgi:hypothetical protein